MRGKLQHRQNMKHKYRITPADAGKTRTVCQRVHGDGDHPRGCGENLTDRKNAAERLGSPPRMRGKPNTRNTARKARGITPADAGKTRGQIQTKRAIWDHPRGCGENGFSAYCQLTLAGSPPRMRGKQKIRAASQWIEGITPADAGKTLKRVRPLIFMRDHPRGCGENIRRRAIQLPFPGSPPRMRGKQLTSNTIPLPTRITPADAGKTITVMCKIIIDKDHPRGCGENLLNKLFNIEI